MTPTPSRLAAELEVFAVRHSLLAAALRSGDYARTKFVLMDDQERVCATGLACLYAERSGARITHRLIDLNLTGTLADLERCYRFESMDRTYGGLYPEHHSTDIKAGSSSHMIEEVMAFYNWSTPQGAFHRLLRHENAFYQSVADASDRGVPWDVIADWIEEGRVR